MTFGRGAVVQGSRMRGCAVLCLLPLRSKGRTEEGCSLRSNGTKQAVGDDAFRTVQFDSGRNVYAESTPLNPPLL